MKENEILEEIHRGRADLARECGYDVDKILARIRERVGDLEAQGWKIVSFPPRPAEKFDAVHEDPPEG
jgi:hypothetical protein